MPASQTTSQTTRQTIRQQSEKNKSHACSLLLQRIPDVTVEVVVASEEQSAALGESYGGDAADDVVVGEHADLLVSTDVEQTTGRIVRARGESVTAREELNET